MIRKMRYRAGVIGLGRLGKQLTNRLVACGIGVDQVMSRSLEKTAAFAKTIGARPVYRVEDMAGDLDLYFLAVPDDQIAVVASRLATAVSGSGLVVHTSGATSGSVLAPFFQNFGVFYPLQTFSADKEARFEEIPILVDANKVVGVEVLVDVATRVGKECHHVNDAGRKRLHVAAVFANNFINHLAEVSFQILDGESIPLELLQPLLEETFEKILSNRPGTVQTGPAMRKDKNTIEAHLRFLKEENPAWEQVYAAITRSIRQMYR